MLESVVVRQEAQPSCDQYITFMGMNQTESLIFISVWKSDFNIRCIVELMLYDTGMLSFCCNKKWCYVKNINQSTSFLCT